MTDDELTRYARAASRFVWVCVGLVLVVVLGLLVGLAIVGPP